MVLLSVVLKRSILRELFRLSTLAYLDIGAALIGLSAHMGSFSMELKWLKMDGISMHYAAQSTVSTTKTFTENWDSKRHLLELYWPI